MSPISEEVGSGEFLTDADGERDILGVPASVRPHTGQPTPGPPRHNKGKNKPQKKKKNLRTATNASASRLRAHAARFAQHPRVHAGRLLLRTSPRRRPTIRRPSSALP